MIKVSDKHKEGFTLIELIAVLTILLVVSISSIITYSKVLHREEEEDYNRMVYNINSAAKTYLSVANLNCNSYKITLDKLRSTGLIASNLVNQKNNKTIDYLNSYVEVSFDTVNTKCTYNVVIN